MKRRRFPTGMEATEADHNAIHERTEEGIGDLVRAVANANNDPDKLIFNNDPPQVSGGPSSWTVTVPKQDFAIDGIVGQLAQSQFNVDDAAGTRTLAVFLRIQRVDASATRFFLDLSDPTTPARGSADFVVQEDWQAAIVVVDPYTGPGDDPVAGPTDVGDPIKLATLDLVAATSLSVNADPDNNVWVFPVGVAPGAHATEHLPGGTDPIQLATPSQAGIISAADMATVIAALTNLTVNAASPFLARTITGDNGAGGPKAVEIVLRTLADTFRTVDDAGTDKLGLNFPVGGNSGSLEQPARADHKHDLSDSPIQVATNVVQINDPTNQLGSLIQVVAPANFAMISHVTVHWLAPTITAPFYPLVEASWSSILSGGSSLKVGVKYTLAGNRDLRLRIGDHALCELTPEELALVTAVTGSQTWDSVAGTGGLLPTTGSLVVTITGVRLGLSIP